MLGKLYNLFAFLAVASVLAGGGFAGYLYGSGRLNAERAEQIAAIMRGEPMTTVPAESGEVPTQPPEADGPQVAKARSADEIRRAREREQLQHALSDRAARDADARRELVDQALQHLLTEREAFETRKKDWLAQRAKLTARARDEGFQTELKIVSRLKPRVAKAHILKTWQKQQADAVRLLKEMDVSKVRKILEEFKGPEEEQIAHELLEQLRLQGIDRQAP